LEKNVIGGIEIKRTEGDKGNQVKRKGQWEREIVLK